MRASVAALLALACCVSLAVGVGVAGAAHEEPKRSILGFELTDHGTATVYFTTSFDLSDPDAEAAYEQYANNESRRADYRADAVAELRRAAAIGSNGTGYEMEIRDPSVRTYTEDGYGRVEVQATWVALAFHDQRRVIVAQPFRNGYEPDRNVAIHGPEGYRRNRTAPQPIRARQNSVLIDTSTSDFSNFFIEFVDPDAPTATPSPSPTESPGGTAPPDDGGWGLVLQALAIALVPAALFVLAVRRE